MEARSFSTATEDGEVGLYVLDTSTDESAHLTSEVEWCDWIEL